MYDPVDWSFELVQEEGSNEAELVFTARIDEGWHLYSQFLGDDGPIPTQFYFKDSANYERTGPTRDHSAGSGVRPQF